MNHLETVVCYFDAWNRRDPQAVANTFAREGTYNDPTTKGKISGAAIARYVQNLCDAFPDLSFQVVSAAQAGPNRVAAQWLMTGTHQAPINDLSTTGKRLTLYGADFFVLDGCEIRSVQGYFDTGEIAQQVGLHIFQ